MQPQLFGDQVAPGDLDLFRHDVAGQADHLHPVDERAGDGFHLVGRTDEQDLGQIEADIEIVVEEVLVLLRVEDLEQGRGRVALETGADLVDLVEHDQRVGGLAGLDRLEELARHRADVGPAVALDFSLVPHPAEGKAVELAAQTPGDGLPDRGLADARGPTRRMIDPEMSPLMMPTEISSRIRSLTSSRP